MNTTRIIEELKGMPEDAPPEFRALLADLETPRRLTVESLEQSAISRD